MYEENYEYRGGGLLPCIGIHTPETTVRILNYDVTSNTDRVEHSYDEVCGIEKANLISQIKGLMLETSVKLFIDITAMNTIDVLARCSVHF